MTDPLGKPALADDDPIEGLPPEFRQLVYQHYSEEPGVIRLLGMTPAERKAEARKRKAGRAAWRTRDDSCSEYEARLKPIWEVREIERLIRWVKWKKQEDFMSKLFGADWREKAEKRRRAKMPKFPRRA